MAKEIMPQQLREKKNKAVTVAAVAAFFLAAVTAFAFSGEVGTTDEDLPFMGTFMIASVLYFILIYTLVLLVIGLFKDNKTE
jgi:FtsH-binding integral membrane protein